MSQTPEHALERLVFFSDAVFAIAITLLVIEIHVPELSRSASDSQFLWALVRLIPNFVGFAVSFAVIGAFWAGHHRSFMLATRYSASIVPWNLAVLGAVAFMPFVTAFMSKFSGLRVPTATYCFWMLLVAALNVKVVALVTSPEMSPDAGRADVADARNRSFAVVIAAAIAAALSLVIPVLAQAALATIPLWRWLISRRVSNARPPERLPSS
ncbi:MAG: TMEM175 family protein [Devosia sp.]